MDKLSLDEFLDYFKYTETGIHNMISHGILYPYNDCCGVKMQLLLKRMKFTWQCKSCRSTKSLLRNSIFEVCAFICYHVF